MAERAGSNFLTVTELADTLVRREEVSFRQAHELVSASVKDLRGQYSATAMVDSVTAAFGVSVSSSWSRASTLTGMFGLTVPDVIRPVRMRPR